MSHETRNGEPEERHRMLASVSFVAVLIVIGVPLWWKTTEVYRASLPYDRIAALQDTKVYVAGRVTVLANDEATASEVAGLLGEVFAKSDILRLTIDKQVLHDDLRRSVTAAADEAEAARLLADQYDLNAPGHMHVVQRGRLSVPVWLGDQRAVFFKDSSAALTIAKVLEHWIYQTASLAAARSARGSDDVGRGTRLPPHAHYDVTLSVALPDPDSYKLVFPAREALEDYIGTFVDKLSFLHNFTLKSQWLHHLDLDLQAKKVGSHYEVEAARLPHLLTPLEKRSGAHVTRHAPVNLVLLATSCAHPHLLLRAEDGSLTGPISGFLSARWGGVVIASPDEEVCARDASERVFAPHVDRVMGFFLAQLRELLGFKKLPQIPDAMVAPLRSVAPRRWELDAVARLRTLEQFTSAQLTLRSISQLLGEIPNIVINDEVGHSIRSAVEDAAAAAAAGDLLAAFSHSRRALLRAEYAFTSPSLLALLYFPDDQKYAVYIPLFLPVMLPVLMSLKNIAAWMWSKEKKVKTE